MSSSALLSVARKEFKYLLSLKDRTFLLNALDKLLIPDAYGDYDGYSVRSVYFDSLSNEDYLEKKLHKDEKKRVRLRVYTPEDSVAKFELKRKSYGRELKESLVIAREDAQRLLQRDYSVLLQYREPLAAYAYNLMTTRQYRPVSCVEYKRRAYTHPNFNTRITMDNHLRYCRFSYDLFAPRLDFHYAMPLDQTILEVKYNHYLFKQLQNVLCQCDLTGKAPSKFGSSRELLDYFYY